MKLQKASWNFIIIGKNLGQMCWFCRSFKRQVHYETPATSISKLLWIPHLWMIWWFSKKRKQTFKITCNHKTHTIYNRNMIGTIRSSITCCASDEVISHIRFCEDKKKVSCDQACECSSLNFDLTIQVDWLNDRLVNRWFLPKRSVQFELALT